MKNAYCVCIKFIRYIMKPRHTFKLLGQIKSLRVLIYEDCLCF